jgi:hypothetical protein
MFQIIQGTIIYIEALNPYCNLIFKGVKIFNIRITPNQVLPDGEDALQIIPAEIACFETIAPCSSVSRDFTFLIQNAQPGGFTSSGITNRSADQPATWVY